ncbi:MAG: S8 family serine peptidase [Micromonosporaceae bacterium]
MASVHRQSAPARWSPLAAALFTVVLTAAPAPALADDIRDQQWHLDSLQVSELHKITQGEGVTVAVIDTGVDATHPDLAGSVLPGKEFPDKGGDGHTDKDGHGTGMASLIAGHGHGTGGRDGVLGMAPKAKILPIRVPLGKDQKSQPDDAADAINWAVAQGAKVINLSIGQGSSHYLSEAVESALDQGVVIVNAAGNSVDVAEIYGIGLIPGVVVVSGTDVDGNPSTGSVTGAEVCLAAPMEKVMAAGAGKRGRYAAGTGTSDSAALVSGAAALVFSKYPGIDGNNVINRLISTADDRGPEGRDEQYGYGVIDPLAALTEDVPEVDANPLIDPPSQPSVPPTGRANSKAPAEEPGSSPGARAAFIAIALLVIAGGAYLLLRLANRD